MKTDDLISALCQEVEPAPPPSLVKRTAFAVGAGLGLALVLLVTFLSVRPDIGVALPVVMLKAGFAAAAAAAALPLLLRLARPGRPAGWRITALAGFVGLCVLVLAIAFVGADGVERMSLWTRGFFPWCVVAIPLLAAPTAALLTWLMRDLAPTRLRAAGAAIGAVAGGVGAIAYAMYCPMDSAGFVVTWYGVAIGLCAALGATVGARFLRW